MFCSWKKSPFAPCSCAYVLRSPISEVLNHLCYLGQGTMVLRQQGLSLAKTTPFGLAVAYQESGWNILRDQVSGLETDTSREQNIYLMTDAADRRPLLAMGEPGKAIDLSIRLDGYTWESPAVTALLRKFNGVSLDCGQSRKLGAGAWLDDWGDISQPVSDGALVRAAAGTLRDCEWLEVEIKSCTHRSTVRFTPSFIDSEGGVLRIADRSCRHVVYADVEAPDFRMARVSREQVRIFREPTAA
ncbi:MAG: hypothetical protein V4584_17595 [Verrucomicrobiota bacterium]